MRRGYLSEYFEGVAVKKLSRVDATPQSNQHEVGTTVSMRKFLGTEKHNFPATFFWLGAEQDSFSELGTLTLYDTREKQDHRNPEWRLYYPSNSVTEAMGEEDTLFLAKRTDGSLLFAVAPCGSTVQDQLLWLFGFESEPLFSFTSHRVEGNEDAELDFAARLILDELGVEIEDPRANSLDAIIERFEIFPKTIEFSDLARLTLPGVIPLDDPDAALVAWLDHEEALFRRLERKLVSERLSQGFGSGANADVDGFIKFSLQVQNRRKSRMGRAFEHHLDAVFRPFGLEYEKQVLTEHGNTADFLFPGRRAYADVAFPATGLTMLAAKSTCKDRWRQVLPEAQRIWPKHLVTLEPAISPKQTAQMTAEGIQLVVPATLHETFGVQQRASILSVSGFIDLVKGRALAAG